MKKLSMTTLGAMGLLLASAGFALAADPAVQAEGLKFFTAVVTAAGFGIAIAAVGCGLAQGYAVRGAVEGTARNPEASGKIMVNMLVGLALIESLCIYALVVALNPALRLPDGRPCGQVRGPGSLKKTEPIGPPPRRRPFFFNSFLCL